MSRPCPADHARSADHVDPVIDLASRETTGWLLARRAGATAADAITAALASRRRAFGSGFIAIVVSSAEAEEASLRWARGARLDGLALVHSGPIDRKSLSALERARERGALVGCDTTASLLHFGALSPDLLLIRAPDLDEGGGDLVRVLATLADTIGTRVLAHDVASIGQSEALRDLGVALAQGTAFGTTPAGLGDTAGNVKVASFRRVKRSWSEGLQTRAPSLRATSSAAALVEESIEHPDHDWIVLTDERSQPIRLVERSQILSGEPFERPAVRIQPGMPLGEVARAALDRPEEDRSLPLVACDTAGRYRGLLLLGYASNLR